MSKNNNNKNDYPGGSGGGITIIGIASAIGRGVCAANRETSWWCSPSDHEVKPAGDNSYSSRDYENNHDNVRHGSNE